MAFYLSLSLSFNLPGSQKFQIGAHRAKNIKYSCAHKQTNQQRHTDTHLVIIMMFVCSFIGMNQAKRKYKKIMKRISPQRHQPLPPSSILNIIIIVAVVIVIFVSSNASQTSFISTNQQLLRQQQLQYHHYHSSLFYFYFILSIKN